MREGISGGINDVINDGINRTRKISYPAGVM
jgi:hypothetical protein